MDDSVKVVTIPNMNKLSIMSALVNNTNLSEGDVTEMWDDIVRCHENRANYSGVFLFDAGRGEEQRVIGGFGHILLRVDEAVMKDPFYVNVRVDHTVGLVV
jgi:hypothetical protein